MEVVGRNHILSAISKQSWQCLPTDWMWYEKKRQGCQEHPNKWRGPSHHLLQLGREGVRGEIRSVSLGYEAPEAWRAFQQRCWAWDGGSEEGRTTDVNLEVISDQWCLGPWAWMRIPRAWVKRNKGFLQNSEVQEAAGLCKQLWEGTANEVWNSRMWWILEAK